MKKIFLGLLIITAALLPKVSLAHSEVLTVQIFNSQTYAKISSFTVPTANLAGGASIAAADLGTDGIPEIIVGNGLGNEPRVHVLRQDGSEIGSFLAYAPDMGVGINIVACDLNNDGLNEIITAPQKGGGPQIRVFNNLGETFNEDFFAYAESFRGGVNLACGDLNNDSLDELVTLPAAGGGPHVRIWKNENNKIILNQEFFAFEANDRRGLVGTISDGKLIIASSEKNPTTIKTYKVTSSAKLIHSFEWTDEGTSLGTSGIFSLNNNLMLSVEGSQHIINLTDENHPTTTTIDSFSPRATAADLNQDGKDELVTINGKYLYSEHNDAQYIAVDLSEQRLYAYENGILANTFLVSTARYPFITPVGIHSVLAKKPIVDYTWSYGVDNPNNFSLGPTPWNLNFYGHLYIHYAWWHNNFGHPMSHGCINVNLTNIKWLYDWAVVGTPVEVKE